MYIQRFVDFEELPQKEAIITVVWRAEDYNGFCVQDYKDGKFIGKPDVFHGASGDELLARPFQTEIWIQKYAKNIFDLALKCAKVNKMCKGNSEMKNELYRNVEVSMEDLNFVAN